MGSSELKSGTLFDIQGFSVHDGPGCRTLIFMKGCGLECRWCSNPEGLLPFPHPLYNSSKCIFDNLCVVACRQHAITATAGSLTFDTMLCSSCESHECEEACCTGALRIAGYSISEGDLFKKIQRDRQYWGSNGGITLTGGEPLRQTDFVVSFLKKCHEAYIHTAAETCGNIPWKSLESTMDYLDWIFFDLKHMDEEAHAEWTGSSNQLILENAKKLSSRFGGRLIFRMPVVPGFNDSVEVAEGIADFLNELNRNEINLLPVHHLGREKYRLMGMNYYSGDLPIPTREVMMNLQAIFHKKNIQCYIGTDTPF
jgi:pyruvate formate lyase activating enzyme